VPKTTFAGEGALDPRDGDTERLREQGEAEQSADCSSMVWSGAASSRG
jgi:hypothetical protein